MHIYVSMYMEREENKKERIEEEKGRKRRGEETRGDRTRGRQEEAESSYLGIYAQHVTETIMAFN